VVALQNNRIWERAKNATIYRSQFCHAIVLDAISAWMRFYRCGLQCKSTTALDNYSKD
jgi:hypothetical protein